MASSFSSTRSSTIIRFGDPVLGSDPDFLEAQAVSRVFRREQNYAVKLESLLPQ